MGVPLARGRHQAPNANDRRRSKLGFPEFLSGSRCDARSGRTTTEAGRGGACSRPVRLSNRERCDPHARQVVGVASGLRWQRRCVSGLTPTNSNLAERRLAQNSRCLLISELNAESRRDPAGYPASHVRVDAGAFLPTLTKTRSGSLDPARSGGGTISEKLEGRAIRPSGELSRSHLPGSARPNYPLLIRPMVSTTKESDAINGILQDKFFAFGPLFLEIPDIFQGFTSL